MQLKQLLTWFDVEENGTLLKILSLLLIKTPTVSLDLKSKAISSRMVGVA